MLKRLTFILLLMVICSYSYSQVAIDGTWATGEENTIIETYEKEDGWYGKIISSDNPKAKIGNDILIGFVEEEGEWKGKLFAAKRGKTLDAKIQPTDSELVITVSAGFFTKTLNWKKVEGKK